MKNRRTFLILLIAFCSFSLIEGRYFDLLSPPSLLHNDLNAEREFELKDVSLGGEAGFIQLNSTYDSNMFYWFFPSQDGNQEAPLVFWLEGGPGVPGTFSVFAGPGPYRLELSIPLDFQSELNIVTNNYTWNLHNHLLFVDNPIGTGFSYTSNPLGFPLDETQVASDLLRFLNLFLVQYPTYSSNDIFIAGESYGGKYAFALTDLIIQTQLQEGSQVFKNMKGIILGDPLIDPAAQAVTWASYAENTGILSSTQAQEWNSGPVSYLLEQIAMGNYYNASLMYYETILSMSSTQNTSIYNVVQYALPLPNIYISSFYGYALLVNSTAVRKELNVYPHIYQGFLDYGFYSDVSKPISNLFPGIIAEFPVLIYNGQLDWLINVVGTQNWIAAADPTQVEFIDAPLKPVLIPPSADYAYPTLGYMLKSGGNLNFAVIPNSGHFGLLDNPQAVLQLVTGFINKNI